jgi:hypothetical protein
VSPETQAPARVAAPATTEPDRATSSTAGGRVIYDRGSIRPPAASSGDPRSTMGGSGAR